MLANMKNRIRERRKARDWTIEYLADVVGTSKGHISGIETGKREASLPMLRKIAEALGVAEADLLQPETEQDNLLHELIEDFPSLSHDDQVAVLNHARGLRAKSDP